VVGSVRDLTSAGAAELQATPKADGSRLLLVKIESASLTDPEAAVKQIQTEGVAKLDVVIASAGITGKLGPLAKTDLADFEHALKVNAIAPAALFQATQPLLNKSEKPKWISLSTISASLGTLEQNAAFPTLSYGASKAAFNFITRSIHVENENIIAVAVHPG
jgi:NAD(P)-dependent dehydrogenase (short-subunit alcohol dehydrogenase family)